MIRQHGHGGLKLNANLSRHMREMKTEKRPITKVRNREGMNKSRARADDQEINRNNDIPSIEGGSLANHSKQQWSKLRSYANVLTTETKSMGKRGNQRQKQQTSIISHSTMQLNIPVEQMNRFNNTWVGKLRKLDIFDKLEEELMWEAGQEIRPTYMGDDMVLLVGLTDSQVQHMCINEDENGMSLFHSLEKWNPGMQPGNKLVWLQC